MGLFSFLGDALKTVAPFTAFVPGVGPLVAGGLALGGSLLGDAVNGDGFDLGGDLKNGIGGALGSYAMGGQGVNGLLKGGSLQLPMFDGQGNIIGMQNVNPQGGGGVLGTLGKLAPYVLGGAGALSAANAQGNANDLREEALNRARGAYDEKAPLRARALSILSGPLPTPPNLSGLADTANPYRKNLTLSGQSPVNAGGLPAPSSAGMASGPPAGVTNLLGNLAGAASKLPHPPANQGPSRFTQNTTNLLNAMRSKVPEGVVNSAGKALTPAQYQYAMSHRSS